MKSKYILQTSLARCPFCRRSTSSLLMNELAVSKAIIPQRYIMKELVTRSPMFHICWKCRKVFELGKSIVQEVKDNERV